MGTRQIDTDVVVQYVMPDEEHIIRTNTTMAKDDITVTLTPHQQRIIMMALNMEIMFTDPNLATGGNVEAFCDARAAFRQVERAMLKVGLEPHDLPAGAKAVR